jgi:hemerythrin-like domain-containing protein
VLSGLYGRAVGAVNRDHPPINSVELLARDHGMGRRILFIYEEVFRRFHPDEDQPTELIRDAAKIYQRFINEFHQELEEEHLFPRFEKARVEVDLIKILREQHVADRRLTTRLLGYTSAAIFKDERNRSNTRDTLCRLAQMVRRHTAWEESVLFPAFRCLVTDEEYRDLGEIAYERQLQLFGCDGVERTLGKIVDLEEALEIQNLAAFAPPE